MYWDLLLLVYINFYGKFWIFRVTQSKDILHLNIWLKDRLLMMLLINQAGGWYNIFHTMGKEWSIYFVWSFVRYFCYVRECMIYRRYVHKDRAWKVRSWVYYIFCRGEDENKYHWRQWTDILLRLREGIYLSSCWVDMIVYQ